ncbi:MAG: hypothetical protein JW902_14935 [Syntrophaceae bacterium]|nr:hypothetical protein [Syntrophaceae bacterium]
MAIILYLPDYEEKGEALLQHMAVELPQRNIEIYRIFPDLCRRLLQPLSDVRVAVLFCMTKNDFLEILSLGDLLLELKIILILPDDDRDTIIKAHNLRPRYLSWVDQNYLDIGAVLRRMVELYDPPQVVENR